MNRRESLKALGITTITTGILLVACNTEENKPSSIVKTDTGDTSMDGLQEFEKERLRKLNSQGPFFDEHERLTLILLADIIIPRDDVSGSASDAKVIDFIEFIVKDIPDHQVPMRGGLKWLDLQCLKQYGHSFIASSSQQQVEMVTAIAYPLKATPDMHPGAVFFSRMRDLTATGFYTSKIGIEDIGYVGNAPGKWEGVPQDVLAQYNLANV